MGDRREDDLSAIAWPGFVDILSSVIIMFVFFLLIVATALYFHMIIYISKVDSSNIEVQLVNDDVNQGEDFVQMQTQFAESKEQKIITEKDSDNLVIFFGEDSISLIPEIKTQIEELITNEISKYGPDGFKVILHTSKFEKGSNIMARKIAVSRMLNVRNSVLKSGLFPENITPKIINGYEIENNSHWVKLEIAPK